MGTKAINDSYIGIALASTADVVNLVAHRIYNDIDLKAGQMDGRIEEKRREQKHDQHDCSIENQNIFNMYTLDPLWLDTPRHANAATLTTRCTHW